MISNNTVALLESFKVNLNELHKLNDEQLKQVKQSLIQSPGHSVYEDLRDSADFSGCSFDFEILSNLLLDIVDILARKLPQEVNFNNAKLE
jgi:hypothetical protein